MDIHLRRASVVATACLAFACVSRASADEFLLASGGRVVGEFVNPTQSPRTEYVVKLSAGGTLALGRDQVKQVVRTVPERAEYEALRHQQPDTVAGHWALAEWCKEHKLSEDRKGHLARVIELDPNHEPARAALGYNRLDGAWQTQAEFLSAQGMVQYKGQWRYPQWIEITEAKQKAEQTRQQWFGNLKRWRDWLGGEKSQIALDGILKIDDPAALPALQQFMTGEPDEEVRKLYAQALINIGTPSAVLYLADRSLNDRSPEIRLSCLEMLDDKPRPDLVDFYIKNLQSKDNNVVNYAAVALSHFKDPRSTAPLIDALVTTHKYAVTTGNPGGGMSASQSSGNGFGSTGFSSGSSTRIITEPKENQAVLETLVVLIDGRVNYRFDIAAWKQWYAGQKKQRLIDVRRSN